MSWGKIYCQSWWGNEGEYERLIESGALPSPPAPFCIGELVSDYIERIEADGGTVEATECIGYGMPPFVKESSSLFLPASGYKAGTVYSVIPDPDVTYGANTVLNGHFTSLGSWTRGTGVEIANERCEFTASNEFGALSQGCLALDGNNERIRFDCQVDSGSFEVYAGNTSSPITISTSGYHELFIPQSGNAFLIFSTANNVFTGWIDNVFAEPQLHVSGDFTSARNGPAYRTNENGVLEEMANDVCRVDYSGGGCPSLLLEPASTNLFLNSEVGVSQIISGMSIGVEYTLTFYEGDGNIDISSTPGDPVYVGVPFTFTTASNNYNFTVTGTCNKVQLELGGYATSYIKTEGTTVTRPQDTLAQTTPNSDMYNSEEGVFMVDIASLVDPVTSNKYITLTDGTTLNTIELVFVTTNIRSIFRVAGQSAISFTTSQDIANFNKVAIRYKANDFSLWINGTKINENLSAVMMPANTLDRVYFSLASGSSGFEGKCKSLAYFPSFLTDEEMAQLTT